MADSFNFAVDTWGIMTLLHWNWSEIAKANTGCDMTRPSSSKEGIQSKKQIETKQGRIRSYVALMEEMHKLQTADIALQEQMKAVLVMAKQIHAFTASDAKSPDGAEKLQAHEDKCLALAEKFFELQIMLKDSGKADADIKVLSDLLNNYLQVVTPAAETINKLNKIDAVLNTYDKVAKGPLGLLGLTVLKSATAIGVGCCAAIPKDTPEQKAIAGIAAVVAKAADSLVNNVDDLSIKSVAKGISTGTTQVVMEAVVKAAPVITKTVVEQMRPK